MKFRQAKKIMYGNSSVHKKYRKRRPPYKEEVFDPDAEDGFVHSIATVYPSLHDIDIIARARRVFIHHIKRKKKRWNKL